jgi:hypothetical protein
VFTLRNIQPPKWKADPNRYHADIVPDESIRIYGRAAAPAHLGYKVFALAVGPLTDTGPIEQFLSGMSRTDTGQLATLLRAETPADILADWLEQMGGERAWLPCLNVRPVWGMELVAFDRAFRVGDNAGKLRLVGVSRAGVTVEDEQGGKQTLSLYAFCERFWQATGQ